MPKIRCIAKDQYTYHVYMDDKYLADYHMNHYNAPVISNKELFAKLDEYEKTYNADELNALFKLDQEYLKEEFAYINSGITKLNNK